MKRDTAEATAAHIPAHLLLIKSPRRNIAPVTHELTKNTCEIPFNQYSISERMSYLISGVKGAIPIEGRVCGDKPSIALEASKNIHVVNTNEKVKELTLYGASILLNALYTQVDIIAHNISESHIRTESPINVGKAHPTSIPLNPHKPSSPSLSGKSKINPVEVETISPKSAPQATSPLPVSYEPPNIPTINSNPHQILF